jgi:hypothetical protein
VKYFILAYGVSNDTIDLAYSDQSILGANARTQDILTDPRNAYLHGYRVEVQIGQAPP